MFLLKEGPGAQDLLGSRSRLSMTQAWNLGLRALNPVPVPLPIITSAVQGQLLWGGVLPDGQWCLCWG